MFDDYLIDKRFKQRDPTKCCRDGCGVAWSAISLEANRPNEHLCSTHWREKYHLPTGFVAPAPRIDEVRHGVR